MHAIGDAAFDQAARCPKAALDDCPGDDHRHGIIHACLPTGEGARICADYGVHLPMQTAFIGWPQEPDAYLEGLSGAHRAARLNPLRDLWDAGIVLSAGSDAPCTSPDPIMWMDKACNHSVPEQSLSVSEALRMCTYHGAWTTFDEAERGSLEAGKAADFVKLSASPYEVGYAGLSGVEVQQLYLQGEPYRPQSQSVVAAVARGMAGRAKV